MLVVLGQRTIPKGLKPPYYYYYYYWVVALVVGLFALAAVASCVVFAAGQSTESTSLHPSVASSALTQAPIAAQSASLDNDLDNDGQVDGIVDSLGAHPDGIANPLVGMVLVCLLIPSVTGRLLTLSLYELPMVGFEYYLPLERPG